MNCINHLVMREAGHSYINKSENFALTVYVVWLLVRAVTGGASDGYGKKTSFPANI